MSHPYEKPSDSSQQSRKSSRSLREVRRQRTSAQLQTPGGQSSSLTQEQSFATPTAPQATILGVSAQSTTTSTITGSPVHGRILSQQPPVNPTTPSRVAPGVSARSTTTSTTTTEPLSRTARILTQEQPPATFTTQAATETIAGVSAQFRTSTTTTESLPRCESSLTQTEPPATPTTPPEAPSTSTWPATTLAQNESCQKHPYLVKLLCSPTKKQLSNIRKPTDPVNERNPQPISGTPQTIIGPSTQAPGQMAAVTAPGDPQGNPQENPQGNLQRHPQTNQQESRQQNQHENRQRHQQENRQRNQQGNSQENQQRNRQRNSQGNSQTSSQRNVEGNSQANSQGPLTHLNPVLRHPPQPGAPPRLEQMGPPPVPVLEAGGWKVLLPNGHRMPVIGLGVYKPPDPIQVEQAVRFAIQVGYRHFDCAWIQGIEEDVGRAINRAIEDNLVTREELFITTKVWNNFHRRDKVATMLEQSLQTMRLDYVDLYLIHWPMAFHIEGELIPILQEDYCLEGEKLPYDTCDYLETWQGMEDCVQNGTAKSIGVANFNSKQLARLLMNASIKPVVNQIEVNPWFNNARLIDYCRSVNVLVQCYSPLGLNEIGSPDGKREPTLIHSYLEQIGKQYYTRTEVDGKVEVIYKTPTQVVLNWLVKNKNLVVVPKSVTELKIYEYLGIFDFDLNPAHVRYLDLLNIDDRMWKARAFANHPHYPFHEPF